MKSDRKLITIISAVNNEEGNIIPFYNKMKVIMENHKAHDFEILFINDGSKDTTLDHIQKLSSEDQRIKVISFSKNFGYQAALLAGFKHSKGDCLIVITASMTDPPELVETFIQKWEQGYEVVYGIRGKRPEASWLTSLRNSFYKVLKFVADTDIIMNMSEFALLDRVVKDSILEGYNQFPFIRSDIAYVGFQRIGIPYMIQPRISGKSHYNLWRMTKFAVAGILSISTYPLRLFLYLFPIFVALNIALFTLSMLYSPIFFQLAVLLDLIYLGTNLMFAGIYIARIYKNIVRRPIYVIDWKNSFGVEKV